MSLQNEVYSLLSHKNKAQRPTGIEVTMSQAMGKTYNYHFVSYLARCSVVL